ncbi:MAG TPA: ATP-binding cassette domain-containing protein [Sporichthyaceae bacterium]|jgi:ABC-2 type transport system ATP-binding protein
MIEARNLTKSYGSTLAVDHLSFDVHPGHVTGLLGPAGAGKSTTIRLMLGLESGGGRALFNGVPYRKLRHPMREVGAVGDVRAFHPGRRAHSHLMMLAASQGIRRARVDEVIEWVGLGAVSRRRPRSYSPGMGQRLALAAALLGDPKVLILDEPADGLDPAGARWLRGFLRAFAAEGRTVFVSGERADELAQVADQLIVIEHGRLVAAEPAALYTGRGTEAEQVLVRTPHLERLSRLLAGQGAVVSRAEDHQLAVRGLDRATVGDLAFRDGIVLHELRIGMAVTAAEDDEPTATYIPPQPPRSTRRRHAAMELKDDDTQAFDLESIFAGSEGRR